PVFFFFQAEDGIRDRNVTGVQTCALPISHVLGYASWADYAVEIKMAGTPDRVWDFLNELIPPLADKTDREIETMSALLASDTGEIGRASCRERVEVWGGGGAVKKKREDVQ